MKARCWARFGAGGRKHTNQTRQNQRPGGQRTQRDSPENSVCPRFRLVVRMLPVGDEGRSGGIGQMTRSSQKLHESLYLDQFRDYLKRDIGEGFPPGVIQDHEHPDFLVTRSAGVLGIEVTTLVRQRRPNALHSEAEQAGFWRKIVCDAAHLCEKRGVPPLYVTVWVIGWLDRVRGRTGQSALSEKLATFVQAWCERSPKQYETVEPGDELPEITIVRITRRRVSDRHEWRWDPGSVTVAPVSVNALQERIAAKDTEYQTYRACCAECWLVIVCDRNDHAMAADIDVWPETSAFAYKSNFDRVFFLQLYHRLVELHVVR